MANLKEWMLEGAKGEEIIAVVIGEMHWDYGEITQYSQQKHGVVLSWNEAAPMIDYEFDDGFGSAKCNPIIAWTKSWIISVSVYDGSTSPFRIPRNPIVYDPDMVGG